MVLASLSTEVGQLILLSIVLLPCVVIQRLYRQRTSKTSQPVLVNDAQLVDDRRQMDRSPTVPKSKNDILSFLQNAIKSENSLYIYPQGDVSNPQIIPCTKLYHEASEGARRLRALPDWRQGRICLIHLDDHYSNIRWFWSVVLAGGTPSMSAPFAPGTAESKLSHLSHLLSGPLCLTTRAHLQNDFSAPSNLQVLVVETLESPVAHPPSTSDFSPPLPSTSTIIMLTSGSSGNSKAVPLSHAQILACVQGKATALGSARGTSVLNWVSMDHVAGLVEAHLRALFEGVDQVHVSASQIVSEPGMFFELLSRHRVSTSFAPNFLLARVVDGVAGGQIRLPDGLDLSELRAIASGGEACSTEVCRRFEVILRKYGAREGVIVPGFGMTETGAGCIFAPACPAYDIVQGYEFASVGSCVPGVEMRVTSLNDSISDLKMSVQGRGEIGNLEVKGPIVFQGYLNNPQATAEAFTPDGWFRTGDMGFIDQFGNLVLTGRSKDVISINGVKHLPVDQERVIEDAKIPGVTPDYVVCFAWRPTGAATEQCCIVYEYSYPKHDQEARLLAHNMISKTVLLSTGARPHILPLPPGLLQKSSLGKLSRSKISQDFLQGKFAEHDNLNTALISAANVAAIVRPTNATEEVLLKIVASTLYLDPAYVSIDTPMLDAGMTSVDMLRLRSAICREFNKPDFGMGTLITHNTVRSLAEVISRSSMPGQHVYQPVVKLRSEGSKTPLWLIHPGVGEVLVFVGLTQHLNDRPVFALRARGFEDGEEPFNSIEEVVAAYSEAIRAQQPKGPYAIAGYSYGSMLAFEISKGLEAQGERVDFLGSFNLPPHIKARMRQMRRGHCLVHLSQFLQLLREDQVQGLENATAEVPFDAAMDMVLAASNQARWRELDLTRARLDRWARVAFSLQNLAVNYEPSGMVQTMDVFYCDPLAFAARNKQEWLEVHLSRWRDFVRSEPGYHPVGGAHYTMLSPTHVRTFQRTLERVLSHRGL